MTLFSPIKLSQTVTRQQNESPQSVSNPRLHTQQHRDNCVLRLTDEFVFIAHSLETMETLFIWCTYYDANEPSGGLKLSILQFINKTLLWCLWPLITSCVYRYCYTVQLYSKHYLLSLLNILNAVCYACRLCFTYLSHISCKLYFHYTYVSRQIFIQKHKYSVRCVSFSINSFFLVR